jgi:transcriptional antiterminator RfaH
VVAGGAALRESLASRFLGRVVAYWCAARLIRRREAFALHCLAASGFETYLPRLREQRVLRGRKVLVTPPLFPGYAFVLITLQWHAARWAPGTCGLIMDGAQPARVPDAVIAEIRSRECDGLIELPQRPPLRPGDAVRVLRGPFVGHLAIYAGMKPRERIEVLLALLGGRQRVTLARGDVEALDCEP